MIITPIKTRVIQSGDLSLEQLLDESIDVLHEKDIIAITSKVVSLCEGRTIRADTTTKDDLIKQQATFYLDKQNSDYDFTFTITNNTLIPTAGIDESNGSGNFILWPKDPQKTANKIRSYLRNKFGLNYIGVIITDSTCSPMRRGTTGIALAHSGYKALNKYVGKKDLFGRTFRVSYSSISGGLAAAAVVAMGEGSERTPIALINSAPFVTFCKQNPTKKELEWLHISKYEDLFAPFLNSINWKRGGGQ
jgi:putative folate metabolism gamma-glutamate ligase